MRHRKRERFGGVVICERKRFCDCDLFGGLELCGANRNFERDDAVPKKGINKIKCGPKLELQNCIFSYKIIEIVEVSQETSSFFHFFFFLFFIPFLVVCVRVCLERWGFLILFLTNVFFTFNYFHFLIYVFCENNIPLFLSLSWK